MQQVANQGIAHREQLIGMAAPNEIARWGEGIGWAVKQLEHGFRVTRGGWNGQGQYLELQRPDLGSKMTLPYVYMRTVDGGLVPWTCSQTDLLACDWKVAHA